VNRETCALLEQWNVCGKSVDEACAFLDWLGWDTYEFETSCSDSYIPSPCIPTYAPPMCEICHCSDHDSTFRPYYISDEGFARLNSMIKTMNKQQAEFENKIREFNLSHETNLRFSFSKIKCGSLTYHMRMTSIVQILVRSLIVIFLV